MDLNYLLASVVDSVLLPVQKVPRAKKKYEIKKTKSSQSITDVFWFLKLSEYFTYFFRVTHNDLTSVFASPRTRPRQPIGLPKVMLAIGGQAPKAVRSVECYSFKEDRWTHLSDMPVRRCRCGVAVVQVQKKL